MNAPLTEPDAGAAAAAAARRSYARLLAFVSARTRDVALAEDALAEAFAQALDAWAKRGIPANPEAWLLTAARRNAGAASRRAATAVRAVPAVLQLIEEAAEMADQSIPDERLKLLFACAHPAIDPAIHTPLMLQTVLGLDAAAVAGAFLMSPAAMAQRLVRAKAKIRDAGIPFAIPGREDMAPRLSAVLEAVYGGYGAGWDAGPAGAPLARLAEETLFLARLLAELCPGEPEAHGLVALIQFCEARTRARRDGSGIFVPLEEQDTGLWDIPLLSAAEDALTKALRLGRPGRFQIEAAIQSAHVAGRFAGVTDWRAIRQLHDGLARLHPTVGALVARAAAIGEADGPAGGLAALDALAEDCAHYQPWWAVRAHLLARAGETAEAAAAYERAAGLAADPGIRAWLLEKARQAACG